MATALFGPTACRCAFDEPLPLDRRGRQRTLPAFHLEGSPCDWETRMYFVRERMSVVFLTEPGLEVIDFRTALHHDSVFAGHRHLASIVRPMTPPNKLSQHVFDSCATNIIRHPY